MESRVGARPVFSIHFKPKIPFLLLPGFIASKPLTFRLSAIRRRNMRLTLTLNPSSSLAVPIPVFLNFTVISNNFVIQSGGI